MTLDFHDIAKRWQKTWHKNNIYESDPDDKPKFFITTPYPYVNGLLHLGHTYTYMRVDAFARYKRARGYNVLFPFAFHATGSPIDTAAQKVKEREEKQINTLKLMGFTDNDIPAFEDPLHWINTFSKEARKDLGAYGMAIDWRREFITTDLNPHYDAFIRWQFNTLRERGYIEKGKHPVVWCPKENAPVGDHARSEGEGEVPQEFLLFKHQLDDRRFIVTATLRPDTVLGVTNLYVNPDIEYVEATVDGEQWILSERSAHILKQQGRTVDVSGTITGKELVGHKTREFDGSHVLVLPATFVSAEFGTGIVHSVPSDSADDLIALWDLQNDEKTLRKYGLDAEEVNAIKPIPVLHTPEYGNIAAETLLKKYGVAHQNEREKLEKIKKELYKLSHYTATLNEKYKDAFSEDLSGKKVEDAKSTIRDELVEKGFATPYYQLTGPVVCRCGTACIVNVVDNQWFLKYSDPTWKQNVMKCLQAMKLYPEKVRSQFEYVIDWLRDWACTREVGLGTSLPWDEKWKIESLSDSTIYNAFYTITHKLQDIPIEKIDDRLFDYVYLGKGNKDDIDVDNALLDKMRQEFLYWYPVDFRNSGKDLVQNHFAFYLFNHVAIFSEDLWPAGIGVNGYVTLQKAKMSKSKGNFKTLRELINAFGADVVRMSILASGEELNDVDWDPDLADSLKNKLEQWYDFALEHYANETDIRESSAIDKWMEHQLNVCIKDATAAMDETLFRTAINRGFFDLQRHLKWYQRRSAGTMNQRVLNDVIVAQTLMLAPFTAHLCEEIWSKLEQPGFVVNQHWPSPNENKITPSIEQSEALMGQALDDIAHVLKLAKIDKPTKVTLFIAEEWKRQLFAKVKELLEQTRNIGDIMKAIMPDFKSYDPGALVQKLVKDPSKIPHHISPQETEYQNLLDSTSFLSNEYDCHIEIIKAQDSSEAKAKQALPGKPAIIVE